MAKPVKTIIKLQISAGAANPAPPVGPALGQHGINIQQFCQQFNEATKNDVGNIIPVEISVYEDRTFSIELKTPPVTNLLLKAAGLKKGSGKPNTQKIGKVTKEQVKEIAEKKMGDLNATSMESAIRIIEGSAKSLGMEIKK